MRDANVIGIDPSIKSTAVAVLMPDDSVAIHSFYAKEKPDKWMKVLAGAVQFHWMRQTETKDKPYTITEMCKLEDYKKIRQSIAACLHRLLRPDLSPDVRNIAAIEGYSYSSSAGPLIDLVHFGSTLRALLHDEGYSLTVYAPMTVKTETCRQVYGVDAKGIPRNDIGLAGGKFTKFQMLEAFLASPPVQSRWHRLYAAIKPYAKEILAAKAVPKPLDDIIDAVWLAELLAKQRDT